MVEVTYHCPYCGALTSLDRDPYMDDKCVTREPLSEWEYASTTGDYEAADGVEFVCLGDAEADGGGGGDGDGPGVGDGDGTGDGCGRTFYLSYVKFEAGQPVDHRVPNQDPPRFDFES